MALDQVCVVTASSSNPRQCQNQDVLFLGTGIFSHNYVDLLIHWKQMWYHVKYSYRYWESYESCVFWFCHIQSSCCRRINSKCMYVYLVITLIQCYNVHSLIQIVMMRWKSCALNVTIPLMRHTSMLLLNQECIDFPCRGAQGYRDASKCLIS